MITHRRAYNGPCFVVFSEVLPFVTPGALHPLPDPPPSRGREKGWRANVAAGVALVAASLLFHLPAVTVGRIPIQADVAIFYFPLLVATADALSRGALPLWSPSVFGGYPLFADGEAGMLYPPNLLALRWLAPETALIGLRLLHSLLAAIFTYVLVRTLGASWLGGLVGGLAYAFSGFAAGQVVHTNVFHSLVWLPLELALAEQALRSAGGRRLRYALLAGGAMGIQALASHIHITLMCGLALGAFVLYRALGEGTGDRGQGTEGGRQQAEGRQGVAGRLRALGGAGAVLVVVALVGIGLSAVQLLPLAELGGQNARAVGLDPAFAAMNSVWPVDLLTLVLPLLHNTTTGGSWGPWVKWETVLYVGILPLALAALGLIFGSGSYRAFFGGLAVAALLLALGPNAPLPLWDALHGLPGFEALRSPGRFSLLFSLAVAVLAGYGVDWLTRRQRPAVRLAAEVIVGGSLIVLATGFALEKASLEIRSSPAWLAEYLRLPGVPESVDGTPLTAQRVAQFAANALSVANPPTAWQLTLIVGAAAALALWFAGGRLKTGALVLTPGLIFIDLWAFGLSFHPYGSVSELRARVPPVLEQSRADPPFRVYTGPATFEKLTQVEPNRLLSAGIHEAGGYSSLEPHRHGSYIAAVEYADNDLLDLLNVRYVIRRIQPQLLPSHGGTSFHPTRPLFTGKAGTPGAGGTLLPDGGEARVDDVRLIGAMWDAAAIVDGSVVARIVLHASDGSSRALEVQAGRDIADAAIGKPGSAREVRHREATVVFRYQRTDPRGDRFGEQLYYTQLPVQPPMVVREVTVEHTGHEGGLQVYGIGLWDTVRGEVTQANRKAKYREVYRDHEIRIYENSSVLPRAFLVGTGVVARPGQDIIALMVGGPFDPRSTVILEGPVPDGVRIPTAASAANAAVGVASIQSYADQEVAVRVVADREAILVLTDPYFPGWVAQVDGKPSPIFAANYLFRAVVVPAGTHTIRFLYQPASVALGALISLLVAAALFTVACFHAYPAVRSWATVRPASALRVGTEPSSATAPSDP